MRDLEEVRRGVREVEEWIGVEEEEEEGVWEVEEEEVGGVEESKKEDRFRLFFGFSLSFKKLLSLSSSSNRSKYLLYFVQDGST